jgi:multidrug efflux pump subunit AcrA (membrane-fusion protein)
MFTRYILPLIALAGAIFAVLFVRAGNKPIPASQPVAQPAQAPFDSYIAGAGLIEASTENIAIGTLVPGVVTQVFVRVGDTVKAGDPLFKIDDRDLQADLLVRNAAVASARAKVKVDEATLADTRNQLSLYEAVTDSRAITREEKDRRRFAVLTGEARLEQSRSEVESASAQVQATQTNIERLTVRASVPGRVLQVKIHPGEFAPAGVLQQPLILLGDVNTLNVRVDIDENDAWRLRHEARAVAYVRGNRDLSTPLAFVRVEPYVIPKRSLTGESTERVDTRVLQALYSFPAGKLPVYVGQQMDVFIDAPPVSGGSPMPVSDMPASQNSNGNSSAAGT